MKNDAICSMVQDLLPGYIDGVTSEKSSEFVKAHLRECKECRRVYDAMNGNVTPAQLHAEELVRDMIRQKKSARRAGGLVLLALLLIAAICLFPLPRKVDVTHKALEWRCGDAEYCVERTVTISGTYFDFLFRDDYFDGTFVVEGYPQTTQPMTRLVFPDKLGLLSYVNELGYLDLFGQIMLPADGSSFAVCLYDDNGWVGEDGRMLTGPAQSREEAVALTNKLCQKYSADWLGGWTFE